MFGEYAKAAKVGLIVVIIIMILSTMGALIHYIQKNAINEEIIAKQNKSIQYFNKSITDTANINNQTQQKNTVINKKQSIAVDSNNIKYSNKKMSPALIVEFKKSYNQVISKINDENNQ